MNKPLIAGIDPGTTTAIVILDHQKRIVYRTSGKNLGLADLLSKTHHLGHIVAIGTDKHKIPHLIRDYARAINASIIHPHEDLSAREKRQMIGTFKGNAHEQDAYAAALHAQQRTQKLIRRIATYCAEQGSEDLLAQMTKMVMRTHHNIESAHAQLTRPITVAPTTEKIEQVNTIAHAQIHEYKDHINRLEQTIHAMRIEIKQLRKENKKLHNRVPRRTAKDHLVSKLSERVSTHDKQIQDIKSKHNTLKECVYKLNDSILVQKIPNLAKRIKLKGKYLYVENPSEISLNTVNSIADQDITILCQKEPKMRILRALNKRNINLISGLTYRNEGGIHHVPRAEIKRAEESLEQLRRIIIAHQSRFSETD